MSRTSVYLEEWCAEDYDRDRFGGTFGDMLRQEEERLLISLIGMPPGRILDLGAGTGKLSLPLASEGRKVFSVDLSPKMLAIARRKAVERGASLRALACDAETLCFPDRAFACAVSSRTLMHVPDWRRAIAELCRVSNRVVLDFPPRWSVSGLDSMWKRLARWRGREAYPYRTFRVGPVRRAFERQGFAVVVQHRDWVLPVALHRWLERPGLSRAIERWCARLGLRRLFGAPVTMVAVRLTPTAEAGSDELE